MKESTCTTDLKERRVKTKSTKERGAKSKTKCTKERRAKTKSTNGRAKTKRVQ